MGSIILHIKYVITRQTIYKLVFYYTNQQTKTIFQHKWVMCTFYIKRASNAHMEIYMYHEIYQVLIVLFDFFIILTPFDSMEYYLIHSCRRENWKEQFFLDKTYSEDCCKCRSGLIPRCNLQPLEYLLKPICMFSLESCTHIRMSSHMDPSQPKDCTSICILQRKIVEDLDKRAHLFSPLQKTNMLSKYA